MTLDPKKAKNLAKLTPEELDALANNKTERPFSGRLLYNDKQGTYRCRACDQKLFLSINKINTGTGWPSFFFIMNSIKLISLISILLFR